jgi:hypothetical protein
LTALGGLGADLMTFTDWKSRLLSLETIDWSKKNARKAAKVFIFGGSATVAIQRGLAGTSAASWSEKSGWVA